MRVLFSKQRDGVLISLMWRFIEVAYVKFAICGLQAEIEFPSDWHEHRLGWARFGLGFIKIAISFPWKWTVPDEYQCSGPTYGFQFFADILWIKYGKSHGKKDDPVISIDMPWQWKHKEHKILSKEEAHSYVYQLRGGETQHRTATIKVESRLWTRPWIPSRRFEKYIDVAFNQEVGENAGSWKGGCVGCSYDLKDGETPLDALRRMERERVFA